MTDKHAAEPSLQFIILLERKEGLLATTHLRDFNFLQGSTFFCHHMQERPSVQKK